MRRVLGIDLTQSEQRPTAYALLREDLAPEELGRFTGDDWVLKRVQAQAMSLVAIDAPLFLPKGACCLETSCSCAPANGIRGVDRGFARLGLGCFHVTKKTFIKPMVYRGIALRWRLENVGLTVLEVYPYGSKVRLWGKPIPKKTSKDGLAFLRQRLSHLLPELTSGATELDHDLADALVCAYTGVLNLQGLTEPVGDPAEGLAWLPLPGARAQVSREGPVTRGA